jgi:mono/diheme cytochrome c family protein
MPAPSRLGLLLLLAGCGGGDRARTTDTTAMSTPAPADTAPDTAVVPAATPPPAPQPDTTARKTPAAKPSASKAQDTTKARQDTTKAATKQDTTKAAAKPATKPGGPLTPQQIALGDSIFHGKVGGGTCSACHGQDAKGTAVAPDLTDQQWINGDGSYDFIVRTVTDGVPKPKQHPAPMPPKGGAPLTDEQVKAVAAYEYSLSHKT